MLAGSVVINHFPLCFYLIKRLYMLKVVPKVYLLFPISCVCQIKAVPRKCKTSGKYLHVANGNGVVMMDPR